MVPKKGLGPDGVSFSLEVAYRVMIAVMPRMIFDTFIASPDYRCFKVRPFEEAAVRRWARYDFFFTPLLTIAAMEFIDGGL